MAVSNYKLAEKDYMSGMKYKDIAEKYSVSINTVKSWRKRYGWNRKGCTQNKRGAHKTQSSAYAKKKVEKKAIEEDVEQLIKNPELTDNQRMFCVYFIRTFNAAKAYKKAYGCDDYSARVNGSRLLTNDNIKGEITRLKQAKMNRAMLSEEDIFQKYMDIAFSDITDYVDFGQEMVPVMSMYGPVQIEDPDTGEKVPLKKLVNTIRFKESYDIDGSLIQEVGQGKDGAKIKLMDKQKALSWIADHMDMATDEQRAKIDNIKASTAKINGEDPGDDMPDDGFMEALNGSAADDWGDPDED